MNHPEAIRRFREKFPHKIAEVIDDFGSTVKSDIEAFFISEREEAYGRGKEDEADRIWNEIFEKCPPHGRVEINDILDIVQKTRSRPTP